MKKGYVMIWNSFLFIAIFSLCCCSYKVTKEKSAEITPEPQVMTAEQESVSKEGFDRESMIQDEVIVDSAAKMEEFFKLNDIKFAFDDFSLTPKAIEYLDRVARWMIKNPPVKIRIEGHCCDLGTNEYNLALGDRRANSAKKYLVGLGIEKDRISTISYGEERPLDTGHTEDARAKNRRDHFLITAR
ncbi:MAG: OmpA family protein [Thermodesulfobacteriota bacterium]|nr:OmpA family protein [Thermodesulfobacteriota bacterium]